MVRGSGELKIYGQKKKKKATGCICGRKQSFCPFFPFLLELVDQGSNRAGDGVQKHPGLYGLERNNGGSVVSTDL